MISRKIFSILMIMIIFLHIQGPLARDTPPIDEREETVHTCDEAKNRAKELALELISMGASQVVYYSNLEGRFWIAVGTLISGGAISTQINYNECNEGDSGAEQAAYYHDSDMSSGTFERHPLIMPVAGVLASVLIVLGAKIISNFLVLIKSSGGGFDPICISQKLTTGVGYVAFCQQ